MKYARIKNGVVIETIDFDPTGKFHPSIIFTPVPDNVEQHWTTDGETFSAPIIPEIQEMDLDVTVYPVLPVIKSKLCFTSAERRAIYAMKDSGDEIITDWLSILDDPRCYEVDLNNTGTQEVINYLVGKIDGFDEARASDVLSGIIK